MFRPQVGGGRPTDVQSDETHGLAWNILRSVLRDAFGAAFRAFARDTRAAAGLELALGCALALLPVAYACFDLYSRVEADTIGARLAVTMADYVSRGPDTADGKLDGDALKALGKFLYEHELNAPADLVFVITVLRKPSGTTDPVKVLWSDDTIRFGDKTVTAELAGQCPQYVEKSGGQNTAKDRADFKMAAGEALVIVEVCARLTREGSLTGRFVTGDVYRLHILPLRTPKEDLPSPTYTTAAAIIPAAAVVPVAAVVPAAAAIPAIASAVIPAKAGIHRLSPPAHVRAPDAPSASVAAVVPPAAATPAIAFAVIPAKAGIHRLSPSAHVRAPDAPGAGVPANIPPTARAHA